MTKDEALKLALEALKSAAAELYRASSYCNTYEVIGNTNDVITAIQKALAAHPAPVQEPDLIARLKNPEDHYEFTDPKKANAVLMSLCQEAADALAARRQWVWLTDLQIDMLIHRFGHDPMKLVIELTQELKEENT